MGNTVGRGERDESKNWQEDGGVAGREKWSGGYTPHILPDMVENGKEAAWRAEQRGGTLKQRLGEEPLTKWLELEFLPSHRSMEKWTGVAAFYALGRLEGAQKKAAIIKQTLQ